MRFAFCLTIAVVLLTGVFCWSVYGCTDYTVRFNPVETYP